LRFQSLLECFIIEIDVKSGKEQSKSFIKQSIKDSIALSELNQAFFNFLSALELLRIEGAI
jgi:hypothetical protein